LASLQAPQFVRPQLAARAQVAMAQAVRFAIREAFVVDHRNGAFALGIHVAGEPVIGGICHFWSAFQSTPSGVLV
jgi:hypothetical protein